MLRVWAEQKATYIKIHSVQVTSVQWELDKTNLIKSFLYVEVLFNMYYQYWGEECRSFYRGLRYQEVCYIRRGSTVIID